MLVVGIDPGSSKTGFAWVQKKGGIIQRAVYSVIANEPFPERYFHLEHRLENLFRGLREEPIMVGIEKNKVLVDVERTTEEMFNQIHLEGAFTIACLCVHRLCPNAVINQIPTRVWRGRGNKIDTLGQMHERYGIIFENDDEADALGIADYLIRYVLPTENSRPKYPTSVFTGQTKLVVEPLVVPPLPKED